MSREIWKPVPLEFWCDFYEVSSRGRVRSVDRIVNKLGGGTRINKGRILAMHTDPNGFLNVCFHVGERFGCKNVQCLVAHAFIPNPKNLPQIKHRDLDRSNNVQSNLRWVVAGKPNENVPLILKMLRKGLPQSEIANSVGLTTASISKIARMNGLRRHPYVPRGERGAAA